MRLIFSSRSWDEYLYWQQTDRRLLKKLNRLLEECRRCPFDGIGKPEPLRDDFSGWWSRRLGREHRLIYRVENDDLTAAQCRYHYTR